MSAPSGPLPFDELSRLLDGRIEQRRRERSRGDGDSDRLVRILALVPKWTDGLVEQIWPEISGSRSIFSLAPDEVESPEAIADLEQKGWLRRSKAPKIAGVEDSAAVLTLSPSMAEDAISKALASSDGKDELWGEIAEVGSHIRDLAQSLGAFTEDGRLAEDFPQYLPRITVRWALLAAAADLETGALSKVRSLGRQQGVRSWHGTAEFFEERIEGALTGETHRWIEAARPLSAILTRGLDTTLDLAIRRASLGLELRDRRRHDLRHLASFLERQDQIEALRRLIDAAEDPPEPWALHLLGSGGVGKTMLLRHLTAQMADREELTIGRVDFDFLNPDFPRLAPGLLLWAFAQELRAFDPVGRASGAFEDSERILRQLHEEMKGGHATVENATDHPLFAQGLELYAQALNLLPGPVILVVDTCEELTKPRAGLDGIFNVDETFKILEGLHDQVPTLRVVFAGRRPLATAGAGWTCEDCELPARDYLALFEMRGFTVEEAEIYLSAVGTPANLVQPVIRRSSPDAGSASNIEWLEGSGPEKVVRCNPYELHFFAQWASDKPPPSPEDIEGAGGERYIELRILRRLQGSPVERVLPILGLVKHLDRELISRLLGDGEKLLDEEFLGAFIEDLRQQEWIDRRAIPVGQDVRWIFSVEEGLRLRLQSYYGNRESELGRHRDLAAEILSRRLLEGAPSELDIADLDSALRVMAGRGKSDIWWREVEDRLFAVRDAAWVSQQMSLLTGPEGALGLPDETSWPELHQVHPLRPAVMGTLALAESQQNHGGLTPWLEVAENAWSLPTIGADLELRALAMALAAQLRLRQDAPPMEARRVWRLAGQLEGLPHPETAAAVVAALEAAVESYEEDPEAMGAADRLRLSSEDLPTLRGMNTSLSPDGGELGGDPSLVTTWMLHVFEVWGGVGGEEWIPGEKLAGLVCMLEILHGRVTVALGYEPELAIGSFQRASDRDKEASSVGWLAWRAPKEFALRVGVERFRSLYPAILSPSHDLHGESKYIDIRAPAPIDGVELDRYLAQVAELGLAEGPSSERFKDASAIEPDGDMDAPPLCLAHRELPPFALQHIRLDAVAGKIQEAFNAWSAIGREADDHIVPVVRHAARAELRWAIRLRHFVDGQGAALVASRHEDDQNLIALAEAVSGQEREKTPLAIRNSLQVMHDAWQRKVSPDEEYLESTMAIASDRLGVGEWPEASILDANLVLDGLEAASLARSRRSASIFQDKIDEFDLSRFPTKPAEAWKLHLRRVSLSVLPDTPEPGQLGDVPEFLLPETVERLGQRRAGLIAWREADYLALRIPHAASILFAVARELLRESGDAAGEAICLTAQYCCLMEIAPKTVKRHIADLRLVWGNLGEGLADQGEEKAFLSRLALVSAPLRVWWLRALLISLLEGDERSAMIVARRLYGRISDHPREPLMAWAFRESAESPKMAPSAPMMAPKGAESLSIPTSDEAAVPTAHPSSPKARGVKGWFDALMVGMGGVIGLVLLAVVVWGLYRATDSLFGTSPFVSGLLTYVAFTLLILGGGVAIAIHTLLGRARLLRLRIEEQERASAREAEGFSIEIHAELLKKTFRWGWPPWEDKALNRPSLYLGPPLKAGAYDEIAPKMAAADIASRLGKAKLIELSLEEAHDRPWEGMWDLGLDFHIRRQAKESTWPAPRGDGRKSILIATGSDFGADSAATGYESLEIHGIDRHMVVGRHVEELISRESAEILFSEPIVHLIGSMIQSSGGLRFRLGAGFGRGSLTESQPGSGAAGHVDVRPSDLVGRWRARSLMILQEEPVSKLAPRSDLDRRHAGWLREFAGQLHKAGAPAVLTLPHLEPKTAAACVEEIAKLLRREVGLLRLVLREHAAGLDMSLLKAVARMRRVILRAGIDKEVASDIVLYAPAGWQNPFARPVNSREKKIERTPEEDSTDA